MSIGDCLHKLEIDGPTEKAILARVDDLVKNGRMSEEGAAERAIRELFLDVKAEEKAMVARIRKAGGSDAHVALASHIMRYGPDVEVKDETPVETADTKKTELPADPRLPKPADRVIMELIADVHTRPAEVLAAIQLMDNKAEAKAAKEAHTKEELDTAVRNVLTGSTLFYKEIAKFSRSVKRAQALANAITEAKIGQKNVKGTIEVPKPVDYLARRGTKSDGKVVIESREQQGISGKNQLRYANEALDILNNVIAARLEGASTAKKYSLGLIGAMVSSTPDPAMVAQAQSVPAFRGVLGFLSNFHPVEVQMYGETYPSVEHAFAAAKAASHADRVAFRAPGVTAAQAKQMGKTVKMRPDWETAKFDIMKKLLERKFAHPALAAKLKATAGIELVERNNWYDKTWGVVRQGDQWVGENRLGKMLMEIRDGASQFSGSIEYVKVLSRAEIAANPHKVYVFGDNIVGRGLGGQAAQARGEPNAMGIPTKYAPSMDEDAFFGQDVAKEKAAITAAIDKLIALKAKGRTIVIPSDGVGSGRAQLEKRAPEVWAHLQSELKRLTDWNAGMIAKNKNPNKSVELDPGILKDGKIGAEAALDHIIAVTKDEHTRKTAAALKYMLNKAGAKNLKIVTFKNARQAFEDDHISLKNVKDNIPEALHEQVLERLNGKIGGLYIPEKDQVNIVIDHFNAWTVIHELTHGLAFHGIARSVRLDQTGMRDKIPDNAAPEVKALHKLMQGAYAYMMKHPMEIFHPSIDVHEQTYGFTNIHEFVSEAFSNPIFQDVLMNTKLSKDEQAEIQKLLGEKHTTMWEALVNIIERLLAAFMPDKGAMRLTREAISQLIASNAKEDRAARDNGGLSTDRTKSPTDDVVDAEWEEVDIPFARLSMEGVNEKKEVSENRRTEVEKYINDVLGPEIDTRWESMRHAGQYEHMVDDTKKPSVSTHVIRISTHSFDPMGTAYHESLHAFFQHLRDSGQHGIARVLFRAASTAATMNQLRKLLKNEPEALRQIETDLEERAAYMYQFWLKGKLTVGPDTKNLFQRLKDFFLQVLGLWTNDQRAIHIMDYFQMGKFAENMGDMSAVGKALMEPGRNALLERLKDATEPIMRLEQALVGTGSSRLRGTFNPALVKLVDLIAPEKHGVNSDIGFTQAARTEYISVMNRLAEALAGTSEEDLDLAHQALRTETDAKTPGALAAQNAVYKSLRNMHGYMNKAGVGVGDLGPKYFPRVWDAEYISRHQDEFLAMLERYRVSMDGAIHDPKDILNTIIANDGAEDSVLASRPGMSNIKERVLKFIKPEDAAPFVKDNMYEVLNSYAAQATRRAEWTKRFPGDTYKMLMKEAKENGATEHDMRMARDFVHGVLGTLGDDINPTARRFFGTMVVYQNVRLLPLAIFSQVVDPMGIAVRGGTLGDSWRAMKRGIKEIPRGFKKGAEKDEWYELAETLGAIENTTLLRTVGTSYTQGMVSSFARKVNDGLFRFNLVEQATISMRVAATEAATRFIARHASGKYSEHSTRWLAELGLKPGEVRVKRGRLLVRVEDFIEDGMTVHEAEAEFTKMKGAINKWVDGAILRPNSAERPIWMNDPHWALIAHLKTYVFAFQQTILNRVMSEISHGNYGPALALMSYVPIMLASDLIKGMIQGGGEQPEWKKGWTWRQYMGSAVERSGIYGTGQFASDLFRDIKRGDTSLGVLGPAVEQTIDAVKMLGGAQQFQTFAIHALPANAVYAEAIRVHH